MIYVLFSQFLFGIAFVIFKKTLDFGQPFFLVAYRLILGGLLLLGYHFLFEKRVKISAKFWNLIFAASIFNIYITNAFEFWGLKYVSAAKANFIYNLAPFMSAFFAYFLLGEKMSLKKWIGLLIGFIGFIPILLTQSAGEVHIQHIGWLSSAELAIILAAIGSSIGWVYIKKIIQTEQASVYFINGITLLIGGIFTLINSALVEKWNPIPLNNYLDATLYTVLGVVVSCILAYNIYTYLFKTYSATFLSLTSFISPIITAIFGWIFLGEGVTINFVVSFILVFLGLYIFYRQEKPA